MIWGPFKNFATVRGHMESLDNIINELNDLNDIEYPVITSGQIKYRDDEYKGKINDFLQLKLKLKHL